MSTNTTNAITEAFWRKKQQGVIGARCSMATSGAVGTLAAKANGDPDAKTTTAFGYSVAATGGKTYTKAAAATIDISALTAHANNPDIPIPGKAADNRAGVGVQEFARRNAAGSIIPAANHAYVVFTIDDAGTVHAYIGQAVSTSSTAYRPQIDTYNEAVFGEIKMVNAHTADFVVGTGNSNATSMTWTAQDCSGLPVAD